jgi:tetratricopeptide (TPR) repeat protein
MAPAQAQQNSIAPAPVTSLAPIPATVPSTARVAIERARQLETQGIPTLAAVQYRTAVSNAPTSVEAARELARFYVRQERWEDAAQAWRQVLFLNRNDAEATGALARAQSQVLRTSDALPAATGQSRVAVNTAPVTDTAVRATTPQPAPNTSTVTSTRGLAQTTPPRLAQASEPSELPDAPAPDLSVDLTPPPAPAPAPAPRPAPAPPIAAPRPVAAAPANTGGSTGGFASPRVALPTPAAAQTNVFVTAVPYRAPAKSNVRVSATNAAKAWPLVNRAAKELSAGRTQNALRLYQSAFKLDPTNEYAGPGVGTSYIVLGRFNDAATTYRKFLAARPGNLRGLRGLADALTYSLKYREALGVNNAILAKQPRDFAAAYQNAQITTYLRAYTQSDRFFNIAATVKPREADVWSAWGESLTYRRDSRALDRFNKALAINARSPRALTGLGNYLSYNSQFEAAVPRYRASLAVRPNDIATQVALADALTYSGNQNAAIPYYRSALAKQPNNLNARLGLGRALVYSGQSESGAAELRRVLSTEPANTQALEALALAQTDISPSSAIASYQSLLARQTSDPARAKTLASIGDLQARNNQFSRAIESYSRASRLAPTDPKINLAYAQLLSSQEQFDAARPVVARVLSSQPRNAQALALQVQIESRAGNTENARALAANIENIRPADVDDALALAEALRATGNPASAKKVLDYAVATVNDPASALRLADATRDAGDYPTATSLYRRILTSNPGNVEARLSYAESLIYQKDLAGAQEQIKQVLATDPDNVEAQVLTATVSLRADTPAAREEASRQANAILANDPDNVGARVIVGEVMTSRQQFAEAVAQFRGAIQADPSNLEARLGLARNLNYSRDIEGSIAEYRELMRRVPTDTMPRLELAQIYLDRNRFSDAEALYNEVLALRRGLPVNATARWKVQTRAYAKLNPLAKLNSPLRTRAFKLPSRRAVVEAPARVVKTSVPAPAAKKGSKKNSRRTLLAQSVEAGTGTVAPAGAAASGAGSLPTAPDVTVPDLGAPDAAPSPATQPAPTEPSTAPDVTSSLPDIPVTDTPVTTSVPVGSAPTSGTLEPAIADQIAALRGLGEIRRRQERFNESLDYFNQALTLDSTDAGARIGVAQALRGQTKYVEALQETDRVLAIDAQNLPARVLRAQLLGDTGKPEQAQQELDALVSSLPENASLETYTTLTQAFNSLQNYSASLALLDEATQLYPNEPVVPRLKAETLTFARRAPEAIAIYDSLIAADPQDADAVLGKARVYNYGDQLQLAESTYRQVLSLQPANYQATTELADVLGRQLKFNESIALYQTAIQSNPTDLATRVEMARVQRYAGATGDAEASLNQVLEADPRYVPALAERGVLRGTLGSYAPGIADLNAALEISPSDLGAQLGLAEVQGYAGDYENSIKGYRAVLARDPQNTRARTQLGSVLSYAGRTDEALAELNTVLVASPNDVSARLAKADVLGRATRTSEAVLLYNQILATDPQNVRARTGLADAYLYGQRYDEAVKVYDALIASDPATSTYRVQRARALGYSGNSREAIRALRAVVQAEPTNLPARLALAEVGTNSGDPTLLRDAVADYRQILATEPSNVTAQIGLGRALSYRGNYGESKRVLNTVLATTPGNTDARYALAETQRFSGNPFDAQKNYQQVLKTQPTNRQARSGLRAARRETAPRVTVGGSYYSDTNGVRLRSFNYGATVPTRLATIGVISERGRFSQNGVERDRNALSLLLARSFGPVQARLILSKLRYDGAPRRSLYDLLLNKVRGPRERYFLGVTKRDIFESDPAVAQGITATLYRAGFTYPLSRRFDLEGQITRYRYSDSNNRTTIQPSLFYRLRPTNPSLRVGLGYMYDDSDELRTIYYSPQSFNATSILADYVVDVGGSTRYGISGAYALTNSTGDDGLNRPADTLFGFLQQDLGDNLELFAQGGIVRSPTFRSNQISGGVNLRF